MKEQCEEKLNKQLLILQKLDSECVHGYGPSTIPNQIDRDVELLIGIIEKRDEGIMVLEDMNQTHGFVLLAYAERMASLAIRKSSADILAKGMKALRVGSKLVYGKEVLPVLSLMHNSARKLGVKSLECLCDLTDEDDNQILANVRNFADRSAKDRSIQAMGYVEGEDDGGFRYVRTW